MKIEWLISGSRPDWVEENYQDGGYVYDTSVRKLLREICRLEVTYLYRGSQPSKIKHGFQFARYLLQNLTIKYKGEIVIRDLFSTAFAPFDKERRHVVILHHLDISGFKHKAFYRILTKRFFKRIILADIVVVVSEYWKDILTRVGCSNVVVIYNSFDINIFKFDHDDLLNFKKSVGIPEGKPIIYLGNSRPEKGYVKSYNALKAIDAVFVTTGKRNSNIPVLHMDLSYIDYLKLLKLSSIVLTMSTFNEGWCRTAHEAMLCGTPVIGSGKGGMSELLKKGGQIICRNFEDLNMYVNDLLNDEKKMCYMGIKGREYTRLFTLDYFKESWINLILSLTN